MRQYHDLLEDVLENGHLKGDRTGTGTISVFGRQMRFDLRKGFPLVNTKEVSLKNIITELLWFLRGDTNISFLKEHGCKIWDAWATEDGNLGPVYGEQWRSWNVPCEISGVRSGLYGIKTVDQIGEVINLLKTKPDSRRLIVSAWNVADLPDESISPQENVLKGKMSLAACHTMFQFYSREMNTEEKEKCLFDNYRLLWEGIPSGELYDSEIEKCFDENNLPKRYLSCQLYQRSVMSA